MMQSNRRAVDPLERCARPATANTPIRSASLGTLDGADAEDATTSRRLARLLEIESGETSLRLQQAARRLGIAPRTLQRRLTAEGVTYRSIVDLVRSCRAEELLMRHGSSKIDQVAQELGFRDARAFHRAFKRWKGVTPGAFRGREAQSASVPHGPVESLHARHFGAFGHGRRAV